MDKDKSINKDKEQVELKEQDKVEEQAYIRKILKNGRMPKIHLLNL